METQSNRGMCLRFAAGSFAAIALAVIAIGYLAVRAEGSSARQAAARSASDTAASPIRELFDSIPAGSDPSTTVLAQATNTAQRLLSSSLLGIRVWSNEGASLVNTGIGATDARPENTEDVSWQRVSAPDGRALFVTYAPAGGYTLEVDQLADALDSSIARTQRRSVLLVAMFALIGYGLLQAGFWFCLRGITERHRRLLFLHATGDQIRSSLDLHDVVTHLACDATRLSNADYGIVALLDDDAGELTLRAVHDSATSSVTHHQRTIDEWFMRRCVATNKTVVSLQAAAEYRQTLAADLPADGQVYLLCVPISGRERVVGVVSVVRIAGPKRSGFTATEIEQTEEIASRAVIAVEQAQLFARVRSHADEIELSYDATLKALMAALDAKDDITEGHCERVAKLTIQLAKHMGIPDEQMIDIERGSLLHDVGKIAVPDAVLKKPDALNEGEWEAMRKHPLLGSLMVSKIGFLENAMPILLYHHERYDGDGYPFGLAAEQIPLAARIFSVIDAYDAMTSDHPYRDARTDESAMAELTANSGTQFDPDVVAAFDELMALRPELRHELPVLTSDEESEDQAA